MSSKSSRSASLRNGLNRKSAEEELPKRNSNTSPKIPSNYSTSGEVNEKKKYDPRILSVINDDLGPLNPARDGRKMRRIIAEDPEWTLATVPSLEELVLKHIVDNFAVNSTIVKKLTAKHRAKVLDQIPTELPIKITAKLVDDDGYWKKCCNARWDVCDVSQHGGRWKRMFFERNLQEIIEKFVPESTNPTELNETLELSSNYIRRLIIMQLLPPIRSLPRIQIVDASAEDESDAGDDPQIDHFDFETVLPRLPFLEDFHVVFGIRDCGMNFDWSLFQFTNRDCLLISKCIANCRTLRTLKIHESKVDDTKVRMLISHILDHPVLMELDLSQNLIGDHGARAIGKFLNSHCQLQRLNLCNNNIQAYGAQAIAHALTKNSTLLSLDLRLNHIGDEGGQAICRSLLKNSTLMEIGLGGNDLSEPTAAMMSQVLGKNAVLRKIDLSCNRLGLDGGKQLQEGMESNTTVTYMDLRLTECGQESEFCISQALNRNRNKEHDIERLKSASKARN